MNAVLKLLVLKRRATDPKTFADGVAQRAEVVPIRRDDPNIVIWPEGHRPEPEYLRAGRQASGWMTAERADYLIGAIGVVGWVVGMGWAVIEFCRLRGWM